MNVEIGVAPLSATAELAEATAVIKHVLVADLCQLITQVVAAPILTFLRRGRSSMSAIPGDINFTLIGGEAVPA